MNYKHLIYCKKDNNEILFTSIKKCITFHKLNYRTIIDNLKKNKFYNKKGFEIRKIIIF
jgi:hypothetical protein